MSLDTGHIPFLLAAAVVLLAVNASLVIAQAAAVRLKEKRLEELVDAGVPRGEAAVRAAKEAGAQIEAARLATTWTALILGWLTLPLIYGPVSMALASALPPWLAAVVAALAGLLLVGLVHLIFAQLLPERIGARAKLERVRPFSRFALICHPIGAPYMSLAHVLANLLARLFGVGRRQQEEVDLSTVELSMVALRSRSQGARGATQREILRSYFSYKERTVEELMVPRQHVAALPSTMRLSEAKDAARQFGFTRYPVYDGDDESIIGVVHYRDLIDAADVTPRLPVSDVMHAALSLSPRTPASQALQMMQERGSHLAVVASEQGAAVGIVTIEDLLREILLDGSSASQRAEPPPRSVEVAPGVFEIDSSLIVQEVEDLLDVDLHHAGFDTIGGYVFGRLGRKPKVGDSVKAYGVVFDVLEVHGARIKRLRAQRSREAPPLKPSSHS